MNRHASELGKLAKGKKKTMSPAAMLQRRKAAKKRKSKAVPSMQTKYAQPQNNTCNESGSV